MAEMLAHEIKNPLAGITGAAQLLSMNLTDEDRELTDLIVAECKRIVKLLEQVEQFGDQRPPERRGINVHDVLERARRSAEIGFGVHMSFDDDYDPSLPEVYADPDQLFQVILNLLKNAAQAQPEGGEITIRTYYERGLHVQGRSGDRVPLPVHIEIIDNGPGLPAGIADSIFEPFVSGRENGTGLGLALVSKIISAHEGWIEVKSRPGRTLFRVSLPLMRANTPRKV
jgi:two-component system nitrogen regulation sensor histidine kinase GlnL